MDWRRHLPGDTDTADLGLLEDATLVGRWKRHWTQSPTRRQLRDTDGVWITSAELEERTREMGRSILASGLDPGSRIALSGRGSASFVISYIAALRAGATVVPIDPGLTRDEVEGIVRSANLQAALVESRQMDRWIREMNPGVRFVEELGAEPPKLRKASVLLDGATESDTALLVYTSGTTGRPKGVPLSHRNLLSNASAVALTWRWTPDDRLLLTLPVFHLHGLGVGINGSLCAGASLDVRPGFDTADVARRCERGATSVFFGVPTMYQRLVAAGSARCLRHLRLVVSGSSALAPELFAELVRATGQAPLERYGTTETGIISSNPHDGPRKPGTVGLPVPGVALRLDDAGEVQVRGPGVVHAYEGVSDTTRGSFTPDGWFRTGDLGAHDADGYLRLVGRSKDLIITGGRNVHPREVESVLASHSAVEEVAVVGRPSERWGEEVVAVVVADGIDEATLRDFARIRLASYKVPKRVEFVGALPRNAMGKVLRSDLR